MTIDNQITSETMEAAFEQFLRDYPSFEQTRQLDELRATDYSRLDRDGHVYLDYTGGGQYANSQLENHMSLLMKGVYGNPHSTNPTSKAATDLDEHSRAFVLEYFNASPNEYAVIFTSNASGALRVVGESYPFEPGGQYVLAFDNHNSVNGIREFARSKGASVHYSPVLPPELRLDEDRLVDLLKSANPDSHNLFAYPAQSNFSGVQHPLEWIEQAQRMGWDVLLDAAAFAPTNRLDLSQWHPDFVVLSFYKIFGYPTGIGCLIARRETLVKLRRPWFAGGTITVASVQGDGHYLAEGAAAFEDGTIDYLNLPAVEIGLKYIQSIGIDVIHERVRCLAGWLIDQMVAIRHSNGMPLIRLYGPTDTQMRGATVTVNFYDPDGQLIDQRNIEKLANEQKISLRTGCFCNPGAGEMAGGLTVEELSGCFDREERMTFEQFITAMSKHDGKTIGAVRISCGVATNFADVFIMSQFASTLIDRPANEF